MQTVLLVDDHLLFRECLALWLRQRQPDWRVLEAGDATQAHRLLQARNDVDLVVLDLDLPDRRGPTVVQWLKAVAGSARVLVLSAVSDEADLRQARAYGADACVCKAEGTEVLARTILAMTPLEAQSTARRASLGSVHPARPEVSARQLDVLRLLVQGKPNKAISRELQLSEATVKTHLHALFLKLEVSSRTQAVLAANRLGLLT